MKIWVGFQEMESKEEIIDQSEEEEESSLEPIIEEDKDKIDLTVNMNAYGFTFMILFVAVLGYLVISSFTAITPFQRDLVTNEFLINDTLLTILIVFGLAFLGLGIYFGWIHKFPEKKKEDEKHLASEEAEQTMVVYVDEPIETEDNQNNDE